MRNRKIECGDLFDNPKGKFSHGNKSTVLICSLDCSSVKYPDERYPWNCLHLWWHHSGIRGGYYGGETYDKFYSEEILQLKKVGNIYDLINEKLGVQTGTGLIGSDK